MKKLERKWKRIISWTAFIHMLILVIVLRWHWNNEEMSGDPLNNPETTRMTHSSPSAPDPGVKEVSQDELGDLLDKSTGEWKSMSAEQREAALASRIDEFSQMESERLEGVVEHLIELSGVDEQPVQRVELNALDMSTAVPVNMRQRVNAEGESGVVMEMQDKNGNVSEVWVPASDITPEEQEALRAFEMMNEVPGLHRLRPLLVPLIRGGE